MRYYVGFFAAILSVWLINCHVNAQEAETGESLISGIDGFKLGSVVPSDDGSFRVLPLDISADLQVAGMSFIDQAESKGVLRQYRYSTKQCVTVALTETIAKHCYDVFWVICNEQIVENNKAADITYIDYLEFCYMQEDDTQPSALSVYTEIGTTLREKYTKKLLRIDSETGMFKAPVGFLLQSTITQSEQTVRAGIGLTQVLVSLVWLCPRSQD